MITVILAFTRHTGVRIAELGFLLILFAGAWLATAQIQFKSSTLRIVGGVALALGAVLLIIATHWGHFG